MKHLISFTLLALVANSAFCFNPLAGDSSKHASTYSFGLEISRSPITVQMLNFGIDQWQISSSRDYRSVYVPLLYSAILQKRIGRFTAELKFGYSNYSYTETGTSVTIENNETQNVSHIYTMAQNMRGLTPGIRYIHTNGKLKLSVGLELPFFYYSRGNLKEENHNISYYASGGKHYDNYWSYHYQTPSGLVYGLGTHSEIRYSLNRLLEIGVGVNAGFLHFNYDQFTRMDYVYNNRVYNSNGTLYSQVNSQRPYELTNDSKPKVFSYMAPALRLYFNLY